MSGKIARPSTPFPLRYAAAVALATAVGGCHWTTPAERAARPIAEKNAAARGGLRAWQAIHSMSMSGTLDAGKPRDPVKLAMSFMRPRNEIRAEERRAAARGAAEEVKPVQLPFLMEVARPRKSRVEVQFRGQTAVQVYDGEHGWKLRPFLGRREVEPFSSEEMRQASQQTDLDGLLIDYAAKGYRVALVGTEKVDGRDAYKLEVTEGRDRVRHVWVDAETSLEVKVDGTRRLDGKLRPVFTYLRDYRPVEGLMIPHLLETTVEGVPGSEKIRIEKVTLNPALDEDRFTKPG